MSKIYAYVTNTDAVLDGSQSDINTGRNKLYKKICTSYSTVQELINNLAISGCIMSDHGVYYMKEHIVSFYIEKEYDKQLEKSHKFTPATINV